MTSVPSKQVHVLNSLFGANTEVLTEQQTSSKRMGKPGTVIAVVFLGRFIHLTAHIRTALQRKNELADVDLDQNGRISFIEYLLLHYKVMILDTHYRRTGKELTHDLSNDGIGLTGVGNELLTELYNIP